MCALAKDIGIDLVATLEDDPESFAAIQCKFYDKDAAIPKSGVDSFIAASNRDYFKQRYIITTNENWSENALTEMQHVTPPIQLVGRSMLASSQIDWSIYLKTGKVVQQKKRTPRKYQEEAIPARHNMQELTNLYALINQKVVLNSKRWRKKINV